MKSLIAAASLAVVAVAAPAMAQDAGQIQPHVYGNLGYANVGPGDANLDTLQGRLGYRLNNWFGVEGELGVGLGSDKTDLGAGLEAKTKLKHQEALYGVGFLPITPQFDIVGRLGYGNTKLKTTVADVSDSDNVQSWNFGVGGQYSFDGQNGLRADYTRHEYQGGDGHADVWSIGYNRRF
jgi:outer membrane immunogenic protein